MGLSGRLKRLRERRWLFRGVIAVLVIVVLLVVMLGSVSIWPGLGARGAEAMRGLIGDRATASIESFLLSLQDSIHRAEYAMGIGHRGDPWAKDSGTSTPTAAGSNAAATAPTSTTLSPGGTADATGRTSASTSTTEAAWQPSLVTPMGSLPDEGKWSPYITDPSGRTVGFRTALQPDSQRGFAIAAVVALDLNHTSLHFVLGTKEPVSDHPIDRPGKIPTADLQPGRLLAAFNGGFQARHGSFGAMANGVEALPARDKLGTLVIYSDGRVDLGAWGTDIVPSSDMQSWRQNGPLVISHGEINPHVEDNAPQDWGFTLGGGVATWRSAVGVSKDRRTLYYVVGPSLTMRALAAAMHQAGVWDGIQLDINKSWTRFDRVAVKNGKLVAEPVLKEINQDNRLLQAYKRDFFYITTGSSA